jgi:branched-subunit amino acid transport protein
MNAYIAITVVAFGNYLLRVSMLVLTARVGTVPPLIERAARYAIPVSFAALAADAFAPHLGVSRAAVAPAVTLVVAVAAVRWTRSPHAALIAGLPTLWIVTALAS